LFEGRCEGRITKKIIGSNGFGYDPVFVPDGQEKTFAQMSIEEKISLSHRKKAVDKMAQFLNEMVSPTKP
jgi:XTP/dITP diphosphohydrolase